MPGSFWSVVKCNVAPEAADLEAEFNEWWSDHQDEYVAQEGFTAGWRLHNISADGEIGTAPHGYHAVYEVNEIADFHRALEAGTASHPGDPWGPWGPFVDKHLLDWERTYYRVQLRHEVKEGSGSYWTLVKADLDLDGPEDEAEFARWYNEVHMPEICDNPGFYRAWRLEVEPDDGDLGNRRQRFVAAYEVDSPANFAAARQKRADRGVEPWDGIWLPQVSNFEIAFYELLHRTTHEEALKSHPPQGR